MATNETNGISLRRLKTFLTNLKNIFAEKKHSHATSDITGLNTALSSKATLAQGNKADSAVQSVKIGTTEYKSGTTVILPSYPTSLPASDVYSWAKASSRPSYTKSEIGLGNVDNTSDANKSVKYATSAGSATSASKASGVVDYGASAKTIQIGYSGAGISGDAIKFIAGYTSGNSSDVNAKIKDVSKDALKSWLGLGSLAYSSATIPTNTNQLTNGAGYITGINKTMVVNALGYTPPTANTTYNVATQSSNGLFSASDKKKLDGITSGSNTVMKLISSTDYSKLTDAQKKNGTVYFVV